MNKSTQTDEITFHSQDGQDKFLEEKIFKRHVGGVFVDVGAHDGITINNSLFFERERGWRGVAIEPIRAVYEKLCANRPDCININCAVAETNGTAEFIRNTGYTEMLSGLKDSYDMRHLGRLCLENAETGAFSVIEKVATRTLADICQEHNIKHINYLSVDVEGGEFGVLKSLDYSEVFVDVVGFENNYEDASEPIVRFLSERGFVFLYKCMDVFMINTRSAFFDHAFDYIVDVEMEKFIEGETIDRV